MSHASLLNFFCEKSARTERKMQAFRVEINSKKHQNRRTRAAFSDKQHGEVVGDVQLSLPVLMVSHASLLNFLSEKSARSARKMQKFRVEKVFKRASKSTHTRCIFRQAARRGRRRCKS